MVQAKQPTTRAVARLNTGNMLKLETVSDLDSLSRLLFAGGGSAMPNVDRPEKVARIILAGAEVGFSPAQALESIWIGKNGKCSIWGDGAIALVRASGLLEGSSFREWVDGEGDDRTGHCEAKRVDAEVMHKTFTIREANKAGLIERARGKNGDGPWVTYQDRMLVARARGFLLRDLFPDVLRGLATTEELKDTEDAQIEVRVVSSRADMPALPAAAVANSQPATVQVTATVDAVTASPAPAPALPVAAADRPDAPTREQLAEIGNIRTSMLCGRGIRDEAAQKAAWSELLATYSVATAREFTNVQAANFIEVEGKKYDPFAHPVTPGSAT